jgi:excisionase family DNA binding protein
MTQTDAQTYTIAEAAALTGLHKNTIRMRVKLGQLTARRASGKFGEEYRITRQALVEAGLLAPPDPIAAAPVNPPQPGPETALPEGSPTPYIPSQGALQDLFQRHEQSMFRLGYLEAELARQKALAEHAESLQAVANEKELELRELRRELEHARERVREIDELRGLVREMERDTERMREEVERHRAAASRRWLHFFTGKGGSGG